jgi:FAD/FMN-containing dehydrogenase
MIEHSGVPTVVTPDDPGYDDARMIFNRSVDRRPARVVRCSSAADVAAAVRGAREDGLPLAVRAGGHNFGGHAQVEGGVIVDLRGLTTIDVDPGTRRVVTGTGLRWAEYDAATSGHGLATPGGSISTVGVSGFTLGTGLGWLSRHRGLAHDNLLAAELVTADGEILAVDDDTDPDLMWALRGGCGNFGAVTALHFAAHPMSTVVAGTLLVDIDRAGEALRAVSDLGPLPPELSWTAVIVQVPPAGPFPPELAGRPALMVNVMVDDDTGLTALDRMRAALPTVADTVTTHTYVAFQQAADPSAPWGACWDVRSEWLRPLGDTEIAALVQAAREARSPLFEIVLRPLGGAVAERAADATAFSFRHADLLLEVIAGWFPGDPDPAAHRAWMTRTWESVLDRSCGGADVNHLGLDETAEHVRSAWSPSTYARLQQVRRRVDPDEVFVSTQRVHLD